MPGSVHHSPLAPATLLTASPKQIMATPYSETPQGYEIQFGTNYIGHCLFTRLLLPTLLTTATTAPRGSVRIVNVSSNGHDVFAPKAGIEFDEINLKDSGTWARY